MGGRAYRWLITFIFSGITVTFLANIAHSTSATVLFTTSQSTEAVQPCSARTWIYALAFSPNNRFVLGGWKPGQARLWDIKTGIAVHTFFHDPKFASTSVAFSPDGNYLLVGNLKEAILWKVNTGYKLRTLNRSITDAYGTTVMFTPNGKYILTGGFDGATVWDTTSGKKVHTFPGEMDQVAGKLVQLSPDGKYILTGNQKEWWIWDLQSGAKVYTFTDISLATFSPTNKLIITNGEGGLILWDVTRFVQIRTLDSERVRRRWKVSPDGKYLLVLVEDGKGTLVLWDVKTGVKLHSFEGIADSYPYDFFPDSKRLLIPDNAMRETSRGQILRIWDIELDKEQKKLQVNSSSISALVFSSDGKYLLVGDPEGEIKLLDVNLGEQIRIFC